MTEEDYYFDVPETVIEGWLEDQDPNFKVPMKWIICPRCEGDGHHGPGWVFTQSDREEMGEDEFHDYFENMQAGRYDVPCEYKCQNGKQRVPAYDELPEALKETLREWVTDWYDMQAEYEAERRMGA